MNTYDVGDLIRLNAAFEDACGQAVDPTTVEIRVKAGGVTTTYTNAMQDSPGKYHLDILLTLAGQTDYRWIGTGAVQTAAEGRFNVRVVSA